MVFPFCDTQISTFRGKPTTALRTPAPLFSCTGSIWSWVGEVGWTKWGRSWRDSTKKAGSWTGKSQSLTQEMVKVAPKVRHNAGLAVGRWRSFDVVASWETELAWAESKRSLSSCRCCCVSLCDGTVSCDTWGPITATSARGTFCTYLHSFCIVLILMRPVQLLMTDFNHVKVCSCWDSQIKGTCLYFWVWDLFSLFGSK